MRVRPVISRPKLFCALLALAIALNGYALFSPKGFGFRLWTGELNEHPVLLASKSIDALLAQDPPRGNVFLRFEGFKSDDDAALALSYYRSVYTLYPRRVFATASTNVVNHGRDLLARPFQPTAAWLNEHDVDRIITFWRDADGIPQFRSEKREVVR